MKKSELAVWMANPQFSFAEIAHLCGFNNIVIDIEHGTFELAMLDRFLAFTREKGMTVLAKVAAPTTEAIQQALDFGAAGVIIPHLLDAEHTREVTQAAKYPPLGVRSYFTGRMVDYKRPPTAFFAQENRRVRCYAMIETPESLADVERIAALDTVDGLFPGPSDLSLASGRGSYANGPEDQAALARCVAAAKAAGKPWIMPAWTAQERAYAAENQAEMLVVVTQFMTIRQGLELTLNTLKSEMIISEEE